MMYITREILFKFKYIVVFKRRIGWDLFFNEIVYGIKI